LLIINIPNLFHLIGLALVAAWLQIQDFRDPLAEENMVAPLDPSLKPQTLQGLQHSGKRNVRVGVASQDLFKKFMRARHECQRGRKPNAAANPLQAEDGGRVAHPLGFAFQRVRFFSQSHAQLFVISPSIPGPEAEHYPRVIN
jgi:hypothetical protein